MVLRGRIEHGVVVLENAPLLPEGTEVTVLVRTEPSEGDVMSPEQRRALLETVDRIAGLPIEGSGEPISAADHDRVLYGSS